MSKTYKHTVTHSAPARSKRASSRKNRQYVKLAIRTGQYDYTQSDKYRIR